MSPMPQTSRAWLSCGGAAGRRRLVAVVDVLRGALREEAAVRFVAGGRGARVAPTREELAPDEREDVEVRAFVVRAAGGGTRLAVWRAI
jgi:hypothetical protein